MDSLQKALINAGIDPLAPARNLDSPDVASLGLVASPERSLA
jgi:hypothetical protein